MIQQFTGVKLEPTTFLKNKSIYFFIMVDGTVVEDLDTTRARVWI